MEKLVGKFIVVALLVSLLVGACAPAPTSAPPAAESTEPIEVAEPTEVIEPTEAPPPTEAVEPTEAPQPVTVELFHMTFLPEPQAVVDEAVEAFNQANPDVVVKQTVVGWGSARAQFLTAITAGIAPDIVELPADWAAELLPQNAFVEMDDLISDELHDSFAEGAFNATTYQGHIYGIPWETSPTGLFYRMDLFEEAGLDPTRPPADWDELIEYAQKLTKTRADGTKQWGICLAAGGNFPDSWLAQFFFQAGTPIVKQQEDGTWVSDFDSPEALQAMQLYYDLTNTYKVNPIDSTGWSWEDVKNAFVFGDCAMMLSGMFVLNTLRSTAPELEGKWATAVHPAGPAGKASLVIPNSMYITRQSKNPEAAWRFIEFFFSGTPSYAERYNEAGGIVAFQKHFTELEYAQDPLRIPFIESVAFGYPHPLAPGYATFREAVLNPTIQSVVRGEMTPEEAVAFLHAQVPRFVK